MEVQVRPILKRITHIKGLSEGHMAGKYISGMVGQITSSHRIETPDQVAKRAVIVIAGLQNGDSTMISRITFSAQAFCLQP